MEFVNPPVHASSHACRREAIHLISDIDATLLTRHTPPTSPCRLRSPNQAPLTTREPCVLAGWKIWNHVPTRTLAFPHPFSGGNAPTDLAPARLPPSRWARRQFTVNVDVGSGGNSPLISTRKRKLSDLSDVSKKGGDSGDESGVHT